MKEMLSQDINETVKAGTTKGIEILVEEIVSEFISPKIKQWKNRPQKPYVLVELLDNYIEKCFKKEQYMNTIVFKNETKVIDDLYIPLTLEKSGRNRNSANKIVINNKVGDIFDKTNKICVIDTAGMGKSTLVKFLT